MTTLQRLRLLIRDREKIRADETIGVGDGTRNNWVLELQPIKAESETITVAGTAKVRDTDYEIDNDTGLITFLTSKTPANTTEIAATVYSYYAFSDVELEEILTIESNILLLSAATCMRSLAADSVKLFAWWSGSERVDMTKVAANCLKAAKGFEDRHYRGIAEGKKVPASGAELWEVAEENFGDQLDLDKTEYLDDSV